MLYEQRRRNLWFSRLVGVGFIAAVVFILFAVVTLVFGGDAFWFALSLGVLLAVIVIGYLKTDRWILRRFLRETVMPPRKVRDALEEMAIAAGIPTPIIYVIETRTLNAFALGREPAFGVVVVTKGLVDTLDQDELRAVLAHEIAHILNGDSMAGGLMAMMAYAANRIPAISIPFLRLAGVAAGAGQYTVLLPVLVIVAVCWMLPPLVRLSQILFGRSRELLADNTAVLLTRDPEALIRALDKVERYSSVVLKAGLSTSHLFITSPRPWWNSDLISTHPPMAKRIERIRHTTAVPIAADVI